tara:strand:+ start:338 stop:661 length:324 start_codon:yes stop_codon:yes gene_type:complete
MNVEMLQKKLKELETQSMPQRTVSEFTQLSEFIDRALADASNLTGDQKIQALIKVLFNMRDFMKTSLTQDSYRKFLVAEINNALNHKEPEIVNNIETPKKSLDLGQE